MCCRVRVNLLLLLLLLLLPIQCQVRLDSNLFPPENTAANIPIFALSLPIPVDQAPPLVTWGKFAPSIWTSWENEREPLEIKPLSSAMMTAGDRLTRASLGVCRGYSRSTIIAFGIARTLMIEDVATMMESEKEEFTRPGMHMLIPPSFLFLS